jgi:outer membrane protein assembly factor BamB
MSELALEAKPMGRLTSAKDSLLMFLQDVSERVGYIVCRFETDGLRWKRRSSPEWASERPHLWKKSVVVGNCRGELAAFRAKVGKPQWNLNLKGCIRSISSSRDILFVGVQEGTVYAYEFPSRH